MLVASRSRREVERGELAEGGVVGGASGCSGSGVDARSGVSNGTSGVLCGRGVRARPALSPLMRSGGGGGMETTTPAGPAPSTFALTTREVVPPLPPLLHIRTARVSVSSADCGLSVFRFAACMRATKSATISTSFDTSASREPLRRRAEMKLRLPNVISAELCELLRRGIKIDVPTGLVKTSLAGCDVAGTFSGTLVVLLFCHVAKPCSCNGTGLVPPFIGPCPKELVVELEDMRELEWREFEATEWADSV